MKIHNCPFLEDSVCRLVSDLVGTEVETDISKCEACENTDRPHRINLVTLSLAAPHTTQQFDISDLGNGFGTRLHNLIGWLVAPTPDCECPGHRDVLDLWTKEYILKNSTKVINWLYNEANKRNLPISKFAIRITLRLLLHA